MLAYVKCAIAKLNPCRCYVTSSFRHNQLGRRRCRRLSLNGKWFARRWAYTIDRRRNEMKQANTCNCEANRWGWMVVVRMDGSTRCVSSLENRSEGDRERESVASTIFYLSKSLHIFHITWWPSPFAKALSNQGKRTKFFIRSFFAEFSAHLIRWQYFYALLRFSLSLTHPFLYSTLLLSLHTFSFVVAGDGAAVETSERAIDALSTHIRMLSTTTLCQCNNVESLLTPAFSRPYVGEMIWIAFHSLTHARSLAQFYAKSSTNSSLLEMEFLHRTYVRMRSLGIVVASFFFHLLRVSLAFYTAVSSFIIDEHGESSLILHVFLRRTKTPKTNEPNRNKEANERRNCQNETCYIPTYMQFDFIFSLTLSSFLFYFNRNVINSWIWMA